MRLCNNCDNYIILNDGIKCDEGYWLSTDKTKPKVWNPLMFECIHYSPKDGGSDVHHLFNLLAEMTK